MPLLNGRIATLVCGEQHHVLTLDVREELMSALRIVDFRRIRGFCALVERVHLGAARGGASLSGGGNVGPCTTTSGDTKHPSNLS